MVLTPPKSLILVELDLLVKHTAMPLPLLNERNACCDQSTLPARADDRAVSREIARPYYRITLMRLLLIARSPWSYVAVNIP
jgi:hypothetical protein